MEPCLLPDSALEMWTKNLSPLPGRWWWWQDLIGGLGPVSQQSQSSAFVCSNLQHRHSHSTGCTSQAPCQLIPATLNNGWQWGREIEGKRWREDKLFLPPPLLPCASFCNLILFSLAQALARKFCHGFLFCIMISAPDPGSTAGSQQWALRNYILIHLCYITALV